MLSTDRLAALDLSLWLRSGQEAGQRLALNQSNVSRRMQQALRLFGLVLQKREKEWEVRGSEESLTLLALERHVHQTARWQGLGALRIEGTYWSGPLLLTPTPEGWLGGRHDTVGVQRPLQWLHDRVIDAWLTGGPDWPEADDPTFGTIPLCTMPIHLVVAPDHPLLLQLERGASLDWDDVAAFPSLALPPGAYPRVEAGLRALGLWNSPTAMTRYRRERWEGKSEQELQVAYATVLSEQVAGRLVRLPLPLPISSGEALVVRREWAGHPRTLALAELLRRRLEPWAAAHGELVITPAPAGP